jgi:hypothetical protein
MKVEELIVAMNETQQLHPNLTKAEILKLYQIQEAQAQCLAMNSLTKEIEKARCK